MMPLQPGFVDAPPLPDPGPEQQREPARAAGPLLLDAEAHAREGPIDVSWDPKLNEKLSPDTNSATWIAAGLALLVIGWITLSAIGFVADQFVRSSGLGLITLIVFVTAVFMLVRGCWAELRSYRALRQVDALRTALADAVMSPVQVKELCKPWLDSVRSKVPEPNLVGEAFERATSVSEIKAVLRARVLGPLREIADRAGQHAAIQAAAVVAVTPSPVLDGLFAGVRGVLVVRRIARIYGLRPGPAVTIGLLHRVAWTVATVSGIELVARTATDHLLEKAPVISHLAGAIPGGSVAAWRLYRLADITAAACSPLSD